MSKRKRRVFRREFKLSAVQRMIAGERRADLSRELGVPVSHLWQWWAHFRRGGVEALRFQAKRTTADASCPKAGDVPKSPSAAVRELARRR